jgi:ABC-type Fe3+ transport system permease subunit
LDTTQVIIILSTLLAFALLGFMLSRSIKKYEKNKAAQKKKKGRNKYMPQSKTPGSR